MDKYLERRSSTPPPPYNYDPFQPNDEQYRETPLSVINLTPTPRSPENINRIHPETSTYNRQPPPRDYLIWSLINSCLSLCTGTLCMFL
jgi:hypothetical protein